jgi:O-antigen ligase
VTATDRILFIAGSLLVVLAAAPYPTFDLDRFFAPKELALHAFALALALPILRRAKTLSLDRTDAALALYLTIGAVSALFAPDGWLAARALAVTLSGACIFWSARASDDETRRAVVAAASAAAVAAAATCVAQAYGVRFALFSPHRAPGGTLGNRNFVAHIAAVCAPALILVVLRARRARAAAGIAGMALLCAALVLTRSRAALLGLAAGAAVLVYGLRRSQSALNDVRTAFRLRALLAATGLGVLAALALPNKLEWKSDSPYLDTIAGLADYRDGSGRGRVVQYARSLRIAAAHPLLGAGPGNWGVVYPKYVRNFDRSIDYATGRAVNPWPSSDWVAVLSERGLPALAALLAVFVFLFRDAWRRAEAGGEEAYEGCALAAVLASAAVVGCFDAFQLLPAPSFLLWGLAGAMAAASPAVWSIQLSPRAARRLRLSAVLVLGAAMLRSAGQIAAMSIYGNARTRAQVARAALFSPGDPRIRSRLDAMRKMPRPASAAAAAPVPAQAAAPSNTTDDTPEQPDAIGPQSN